MKPDILRKASLQSSSLRASKWKGLQANTQHKVKANINPKNILKYSFFLIITSLEQTLPNRCILKFSIL